MSDEKIPDVVQPAPEEGDQPPLQPDGTHFVPPQFQEATGYTMIDPDGRLVYVPGPGEDGYVET